MGMKVTKEQFIGVTYDELLSENAKLREENQSIGMAAYELGRNSMADENTKLRELVRQMWQELDALVPFDPYDHDGLDEYRDRMSELGIEVADG